MKFVMVNQSVCHGLNNDRRYMKTWCWLLATNGSQMLKYIFQFKKRKKSREDPRLFGKKGRSPAYISSSSPRLPGCQNSSFSTLLSDKAQNPGLGASRACAWFLSRCGGDALGLETSVTLILRAGL